MTKSNGALPEVGASCASPSTPDAASTASCPMRRTVAPSPSRMVSLSSMIRMRGMAIDSTRRIA